MLGGLARAFEDLTHCLDPRIGQCVDEGLITILIEIPNRVSQRTRVGRVTLEWRATVRRQSRTERRSTRHIQRKMHVVVAPVPLGFFGLVRAAEATLDPLAVVALEIERVETRTH